MTVLPTESVLTAWDFSQPQYATAISSDSFQQSPAPVTAGSTIAAANGATTLDLGGTATPLGMNLPYNPADPASGTAPSGAVDAEDIANSSGDVIGTFGGENTCASGPASTAAPPPPCAPANGWSNYVQPYTQGGEFSVPTTGYQNVYVTLDWFSTHSGEQDAQRQYSLDGGTTWQNLEPQIQLLAPGNDDWYGDSPLNGIVPVVSILSSVSGANNNPNLAVRLVNSYSLILSNQQNILLNDASNFTLTFNGQTTGTISYSPSQTTMISNISSALAALPNVGVQNFSLSYNAGTGPYVVQFQGALGTSIQPVMAINTTYERPDTVTQKDQYANAQPNVNGNIFTSVAYNGSKGNWWPRQHRLPRRIDGHRPDGPEHAGGQRQAQRSTVGSVSVTFNEPISLGPAPSPCTRSR